MSKIPKERKRIVPVHIAPVDAPALAPRHRAAPGQSVVYDSFLDSIQDEKKAANYFEQRAEELGYNKSKAVKQGEPKAALKIDVARDNPNKVFKGPISPRAQSKAGKAIPAGVCKGTTLLGKPCKLKSIPKSDYCKLHQYTSIVISDRCHAIGRNGVQCKHMTIKGIYCHQHHAQIEHLRIATSTIKGAHLGLFATAPFKKGEKITDYTGDRVISHDKNYGDDYVLQIKKKPPTFISARRSNTASGRYANERLRVNGKYPSGRNNAALNYDSDTDKANVTATANIPAGREITCAYGSEYWDAVRNRARIDKETKQSKLHAQVKAKPSDELLARRTELIRLARERDAR